MFARILLCVRLAMCAAAVSNANCSLEVMASQNGGHSQKTGAAARTMSPIDLEHTSEFIEQTTRTLDSLLNGYDRNSRPNLNGVLNITIDIEIRSMGPITESDFSYSFDCYFRQRWVDRRLSFNGSNVPKALSLNVKMLDRIWIPDTYFENGKLSHVHQITYPNKLLRIKRSGEILYSQRLTIQAGCVMKLQKYPMDLQRCPLVIGSYAYTSADVQYQWKRPPTIAPGVGLSSYELIGSTVLSRNLTIGNDKKSMIVVYFQLQRHVGYFLINVYVPLGLLVVISWVGFWINKESTADRVTLGVTTVLTMTFLALDQRLIRKTSQYLNWTPKADQPQVPYATALDKFMCLCFVYVTGTIVEFAGVHFYTEQRFLAILGRMTKAEFNGNRRCPNGDVPRYQPVSGHSDSPQRYRQMASSPRPSARRREKLYSALDSDVSIELWPGKHSEVSRDRD